MELNPMTRSAALVPDESLVDVAGPERVKAAPRPLPPHKSNGEITAYADKALTEEIAELSSWPHGANRPKKTFAVAARLGQLVAGGQIPESLADERLRAACDANGLMADDPDAAERAIRNGLVTGMKEPQYPDTEWRPVSHLPDESKHYTDDERAAKEMLKSKREYQRKAGDGFIWERLDTRAAIAAEPKPLNWIGKGIIAKGEAVVLTASTGLGKTYITLQMAIDMAVGRAALGCYDVPRPLRVLWIDEEMGLEMLNDRLNRQTAGSHLDERELELLHANLDIRYQQGLSLGDAEQFAIYDKTLREGQYDLVVMDSMVALTTGKENDADDARAFYKRCIAPYKGVLGTAFWVLAHPPKPHQNAAPGAQHDPRGSGDKINAVDRSFYLEFDSETIAEGSFVLKVVLNRRKMRQGGSVTGQLIVVDGPEAAPVHVHSLGSLGGEKATADLGKINTCAQDILVKLRGAPNRMVYQPQLIKDLVAIGFDERNHFIPARNMLIDQRTVKMLAPIKGAPEGRGKWLELTKKADE